MVRVAINGFGRIGRMVFRAGMSNSNIEFVAVNDLTDTRTLAHLLKYDSVHGTLSEDVHHDDTHIFVGGHSIQVFAQKDPSNLPWADLGVDVVVESTGFFTTTEKAMAHVNAGAKRVVISAPAKDKETKTIILGINDQDIHDEDKVLSMASCTSNCLAPMVKVLEDNFGIKHGFFNTIHSYTGDQNHVDGPHKDLRRARACALNIVPTSSGAAVAVERAFPAVKGKIKGIAVRVPTADGSLTDFTCQLNRAASKEEINWLFKEVSQYHLKGILRYSEEALVSSDIVHDPHSCIFDALTTEVDGDLVRIMGWYDNEWGYSSRVIDLIMRL